MAQRAVLGAGLIALAGCLGAREEEGEDPGFVHQQIRARMRSMANDADIVARAKQGEETARLYFDLDRRVCVSPNHDGAALEIRPHVIRSPASSYVPDEQYWLIGWYCLEERMWYYEYRSKDGRVRRILGPYFLDRFPD